ncbi:MarR family winged helix-turn-helix transcriptional regulator [Nocardiopsis flavescens]|uniref:MarR family winged helix-turn-helix transcriptional regulator n=1 Tax=Nocardiopsis flavescens TaxID=758803 RepID=UPI003664C09E
MEETQEDRGTRWLDDQEQENWHAFAYLLSQLPAALEAQMQRDAGFGHFEYLVLSALSGAPGGTLRMSEVAHYTGSTLSRLSNLVSRLEKRGWVTRRPDPDDGRYTLASLTGDGRRATAAAAPAHVAEVRRLVLDPLTRAQQRQLGAAARRILTALQAPCPPAATHRAAPPCPPPSAERGADPA